MTRAFYRPAKPSAGEADLTPYWFESLPNCEGPWDPRFQHAGPGTALMVAASARGLETPLGWLPTRLTVEMLRPIPMARLGVTVKEGRASRSVRAFEVTLHDAARTFAQADVQWVRLSSGTESSRVTPPPPPLYDALKAGSFMEPPLGPKPGRETYASAFDLRLAHGPFLKGDAAIWMRRDVVLIEGETDHNAAEDIFIVADAGSGIGAAYDPRKTTFVNADLSVHVVRRPHVRDAEAPFLLMSAKTETSGDGLAQSHCQVFDSVGLVAHVLQTLVLRPAS